MGVGRMLRTAMTPAIGMVAAMALAGPALADSAQLSVTRTDGQVDPAADVPRVFTVSGATAAPRRLYVKHRAPGGAACAASAESDSGSRFESWYWYGEAVNGAFKFQEAGTWSAPGPRMFCIWLASTSDEVTTPITQTLDFRKAGGTISAVVTPTVPAPGRSMTVEIAGSSEAPKRVFATVENAATACAPTSGSSVGTRLVDSAAANGAFSITRTATAPAAGNWQLCLWLADSSDDLAPVAGPQSIPFAVVAPPKRCKVPAVTRGAITLRTARSRLSRKHCRVGAVRYVRSRTVRRGRVIRLSPKGPRTLSPNAAVTVVVSAGRRG